VEELMSAELLPPVHPAAEWFPLMDEASLQALADDLKQNGQRDRCTLLDGKLLDGRNRFLACAMVGIKPACEEITLPEGVSAHDFVIARNLSRRHLTTAQRALAAAHYFAEEQRLAKERQRRGKEKIPEGSEAGQARDLAGSKFGVSGKLVDQARKVVGQGIPKLVAMVHGREISLAAAALIAEKPKSQQRKDVEGGARAVNDAAGRSVCRKRSKKASPIAVAQAAIKQLSRALGQLEGSEAVADEMNRVRQFVDQAVSTHSTTRRKSTPGPTPRQLPGPSCVLEGEVEE
jgi:hypothetical protein